MKVMVSADCHTGAIEETIVFLFYFKELTDPRQSAKVRYPLAEVLLITPSFPFRITNLW
jgi:hypothetical protein